VGPVRILLSFACVSASSAFAFQPVDRPWPSTPERFLRTTPDHDHPRHIRLLADHGLTAFEHRADGSPALIHGGPKGAPMNVAGSRAIEEAMAIARSMAPDLAIDPAGLEASHVTELDGLAVVTVRQAHLGVPIERAFLSFLFRDGDLRLIRNELLVLPFERVDPRMTPAGANAIALREASLFGSTLARSAELTFWAPGDLPEEARLAWRVHTRSIQPRSEILFFVDDETGAILAADDQVRYADGEGQVRINVDPVSPEDTPAPFAAIFLGLDPGATDNDGEARPGGAVTVTYSGTYAEVSDQSGTPLETFDVDFTGPYRSYDLTPAVFSQADAFVHINYVKKHTRQITPALTWIGRQLTVNVNINDNCNAFWDGQTVNFFRAGGGCNNTGRIASIVYHEFGHGYHQFLADNIVGSVGEGSGDFLASTILNDPIVGRGFSTTGNGIRRIDQDHRFPDDYVGEVHEDGLIWASAFWDLREALMQKYGDWAGHQIVDRLFVETLAQGPGLSTSYPALIAADDDDNDPSNGTPSSCEINAIWDAHGMINSGQISHTPAGERAYVRIAHDAPGRFEPEADGSIVVRATPTNLSACGAFDPSALVLRSSTGGTTFMSTPMTPDATGSKAVLTGLAPGQTFSYYFELPIPEVTFTNGTAEKPHTGVVSRGAIDILSEGFEAGFGGWTHGTVGSDLADDWEVGAPHGQYFDPFEPHSGASVAGTDLGRGGGPDGTDGAAKPGRHTFLESAPIVTTGMKDVGLELWHHFAIDGTLTILADGQPVHSETIANDWSSGWRFLSILLPASAADRADGFTIRFEVEASATNGLGGWSIDDLVIGGLEIPPPPPPEEPPPKDPPQDPPGPGPSDPPQVPSDPLDPGSPQDPGDPDPGTEGGLVRNSISGGCACAGSTADLSSLPILSIGLLLAAPLVTRRR
jgi:hypothetical protein